jgi:hypothetical protein
MWAERVPFFGEKLKVILNKLIMFLCVELIYLAQGMGK